MQLTQQQQSAFDAICHFIDGDGQVFILCGYAGTGKTTLIRHIIQYISSVNRAYKLMAPTGRAANVLTAKVSCDDEGAAATTIHRGIYNFQAMKAKIDTEDIAKSSYKLYFPLRTSDTPEVCIIDEASMLGNNLSEGELFSFGTNHLLDDVITYANLQHNGKLILVGDPAQLPPVGENVSKALDVSFFRMLGLRVYEATLTEVLRQDANSTLLSNAMKVRDAYNMHKYNDLSFVKGDDITSIAPSSLASIYYDKSPKPNIGNSVVICYSNRAANTYNQQIRRLIWGSEKAKMQVEDVMMVINNHYATDVNEKDIMNGEFVKILSIANEETHHIPVYSPAKERVTMAITYVDASVLLADGKIWRGKIITEPVLSASEGSLSLMMSKALYIDFCIRHPKLKPDNAADFSQLLREDSYYNALKVRYGYAVTCHKSQGGEWDDVFIDFDGVHVDRFGLRWIYTAMTRAKQHIYAANLPQVAPIDKLNIAPITKVDKPISSYPSLMSSVADNIVSPFHTSQAAPYLRAKYAEVVAQLMHSDYRVVNVQSLQYLERYTISVPSGKSVLVDFYYNGKGVFRAPKTTDTTLLSLLSAPAPAEDTHTQEPSYVPSNDAMSYLYNLMQGACSQNEVDIVGVTEFLDHYHTTYYLRTSGQYAWIDFFVNGKGFITFAAPCTTVENDTKLLSVVQALK